MAEHEWLAARFEEHRAHLRSVAYRMLGSSTEADDAVQETWLRLSRSDADAIQNLGGWLTTAVARSALDMLRARSARRERPVDEHVPVPIGGIGGETDPEEEALLADSVGLAMLVVLDTLKPAERLAFVLHDLFAVPFDEIAPIVGRSPAATRQLASRARRRVHGATSHSPADRDRQGAIVAAFLAASRGGDFAALLELLDPEVVLRADRAAVAMGAAPRTRGATAVAHVFLGRARGARAAPVDDLPGAVWAPGGRPRVAFRFTTVGQAIVAIDLIADAAILGRIAAGRRRSS